MLNSTLAPKVLRYVQLTSAMAKRAMDELAAKATAEKQAADQMDSTLKLLLDTSTIGESQKQAASTLLASHAGSLQLLRNAVTKIAQMRKDGVKTAGANMGEGVDIDKTGADAGSDASDPSRSLHSPFVGQRTSEKKASDVALLSGLGLPH